MELTYPLVTIPLVWNKRWLLVTIPLVWNKRGLLVTIPLDKHIFRKQSLHKCYYLLEMINDYFNVTSLILFSRSIVYIVIFQYYHYYWNHFVFDCIIGNYTCAGYPGILGHLKVFRTIFLNLYLFRIFSKTPPPSPKCLPPFKQIWFINIIKIESSHFAWYLITFF